MFAAAALLNTAHAVAQTARTAQFRIGGVAFSVPLPEGYCEPTGRNVDVAQFTAALDDKNVTVLSLFPCNSDGDSSDYYLIKAPKSALFVTLTREQVLASVRAEFETPASRKRPRPTN